jgi:hypothetical protein
MTARPEPSIGELMDARDRRELLRAWTPAVGLALLAVAAWIGIGHLPPVPELDPFDGVTVTKVSEPTTLEELRVTDEGPDGLRFARDLSYRKSGDNAVLVDLGAKEIVYRLAIDHVPFVNNDGGGAFFFDSLCKPDSLHNRASSLLDRWRLPPVIPEESALAIGRLNMDIPAIVGVGTLPLTVNFNSRQINAADMEAFTGWGMLQLSTVPRFAGCADRRSLVDGRLLGRMPIPGPCYYLGGNAAVCLSPYGVARVDLGTSEYQVVHAMRGDRWVDGNPAMTHVYRRDGKRFLGAFLKDPGPILGAWRNRAVAVIRPPGVRNHAIVTVELSDPPRVDEYTPSLEGFQVEEGVQDDDWLWGGVRGINHARRLILCASSKSVEDQRDYLLLNAEDGRVIYRHRALDAFFVGEDYLRTRELIEMPRVTNPNDADRRAESSGNYREHWVEVDSEFGGAVFPDAVEQEESPQVAGMTTPSPAEEQFFRGQVAANDGESTPTKPVYRYHRLDDLIPKEEKP